MRTLSAVLILALGSLGTNHVAAQNLLPGSSGPAVEWPRPFFYAGLGGNGGGYSSLSGNMGGGLRIDTPRLIWESSASYDNPHQANDNTIDNQKGHNRHLASSLGYRFDNGWFAGGGAGWEQLSTTNYSKQAFRRAIGGGKDYFRNQCAGEDCIGDFSMRFQVGYILKGAGHVDQKGCTVPGGQCTNDLQGPLFTIYMPSPALARHVFWRTTLGIHTFHTTVTSTDPG